MAYFIEKDILAYKATFQKDDAKIIKNVADIKVFCLKNVVSGVDNIYFRNLGEKKENIETYRYFDIGFQKNEKNKKEIIVQIIVG